MLTEDGIEGVTLEEKGSNNTNTDRERIDFSEPMQGPREPEIVREWRERNPDAERPIFSDAVKIAGKILDEGHLGPDPVSRSDQRSFFRGLEDGGDYALRSWWLPRADRSPADWDSMQLTAAGYLRDREPMPDALTDWLVEVLEGKRKKPRTRPGPKGFIFRNVWIMGAVNTLIQLGMNPTRNITRGEIPCVDGGSACDAVGVALGKMNISMSYKNVEKIARTYPKYWSKNK